MNSWVKRTAVLGLGLAGIVAMLAAVALRDSPARPAVGEARLASSREATVAYLASGPDSGSCVLLFPSFARSAADFNELVVDLAAAGYRTLVC